MMNDKLKLNCGIEMPVIGFGTWHLDPYGEVQAAVGQAIKIGYRLIDTAKYYHNESGVGEAVRASGVDRQKLFVTTKLLGGELGYHTARSGFEESLSQLNIGYIDLYLIHWPASDQHLNAWRALEEIYEEGQARAVGVSNYEISHLEEIFSRSELVPAVNQIEFHPFDYKRQKPIVEFCRHHGIAVQAYSPLNEGLKMNNPVIEALAKKHKKSYAQVMLRWTIQHETVPIPKSTHAERIMENIDVFDFELSDKDMAQLDSLSR